MEREIELRLVARLKAGEAAAFEAAYDTFRPPLFTFLVRLSRRRDVAEDLLEETWLRLVMHANELAADTCLGGWLFTVARNLFVSWCRQRSVDGERLTDLVPSWPAAGETPFEAAARTETERRLESALARLPLHDREVLLLVAVEGFTPSEVAAVLGLAPEAARKRLQRARDRLAVEMNEERATSRAKAG